MRCKGGVTREVGMGGARAGALADTDRGGMDMDGADERGGTAGADERAGEEAGCAVENVPGMISPFEEPCVYACERGWVRVDKRLVG